MSLVRHAHELHRDAEYRIERQEESRPARAAAAACDVNHQRIANSTMPSSAAS